MEVPGHTDALRQNEIDEINLWHGENDNTDWPSMYSQVNGDLR